MRPELSRENRALTDRVRLGQATEWTACQLAAACCGSLSLDTRVRVAHSDSYRFSLLRLRPDAVPAFSS